MVSIVLGVIALLLDQILKFWTVANLDLNTGIKDLPGLIRLTYIKNFGAVFGVLKDAAWLRWLALILLIAFTVAVLLGLKKRIIRSGLARFSGIMLLAGLLGNGIDRAIYGYVVDMFEFKFGVGSLPIFNLADVLILVFGILFCVSIFAGGLDFSRKESESYTERSAYDEVPTRRTRKTADEEYEPPVRTRVRAAQEAPAARRVRPEETAPVRRAPVEEDPYPTRVRRPITEAEIQPVRVARPSAQTAAPGTAARPAAHPAAAQTTATRPVAARTAPATASAAKSAATSPRPVARSATPTAASVSRPITTASATKPAVPAAASRPAVRPTVAPVQPTSAARPASQPAAAVKPAARPAAKPVEDDFDLESILAEFK